MSTLFVVATPIGNLEDLSARALRVLGEVAAIAAEDTRVTGRLLARHGLRKRMLSYRAPVEGRTLQRVLDALEEADVAYLDRELAVLKTRGLGPFRLAAPRLHCSAVLLAGSGAFERWQLRVGDKLEVRN